MKSKYWFIIGGIVIFLLVAGALVWSQSRQNYAQNSQTITDASLNKTVEVSPTPEAVSAKKLDEVKLTIAQPVNGAVVTSPQLLVKGVTVPNAEISVNDKDTVADGNGNFSAAVTLDEGENLIIVTVNDADGNVGEQEITVTYNVTQ